MHPELEAFLHGVFAGYDSSASPTFLTLTAIHPNGRHPVPSRHIPLNDKPALDTALADLLNANRCGWGAYFGVAPRQADFGRWTRGGKQQLVSLPALFIDLDCPHEQALTQLARFPLPPSCLVRSGGGIHSYWWLSQPTTDFTAADRVLRGLAQHFQSDSAMTSANCLRLPGSMNTKPDRGMQCRILEFHQDRRYDLADFAAYSRPPGGLPRQNAQRSSRSRSVPQMKFNEQQWEQLRREVVATVLRRLDGFEKQNGFIAARCPYAHGRDSSGSHFNLHPASGNGWCFGRHGPIPMVELCALLGICATGIGFDTGE